MARWSDKIDPELAAARYGHTPGNYVVWYTDGSAYVGRQSGSTNRIRAAINRDPGEVWLVQFMHDRDDSDCTRVEREKNKIRALLSEGVPLRNRIAASIPIHCEIDYESL